LAEWWYNINFHKALQLTPFEALYGYPPPQLNFGALPRSANHAAQSTMVERQDTARRLKAHLLKSQERMKRYADSKRSERHFHVGDWIYLKLQPYRQISIQGTTKTHKLKQRFYDPFEILDKIRAVAYKLNLPMDSLIHPVFHVSQLKKCFGNVISKV
jgi:hypothetical protein